ncbi:MAG TPA: metal ABC transporter permease [Candidatus Brocadiia bacterium]|nr:metal ABC transporter permease [Candidatus Brocadiia bacterium]
MDSYFHPVLLAATAGGAGCGLLGVYVVGMRIPFIGVFISHAAMAGAVLGVIAGWPPLFSALALSMISAAAIAAASPRRSFEQADMVMSAAFSFMMGLTFLGIGLSPNARTPMLDLLWGSVLFVSWPQAVAVCATSLGVLVIAALFDKELRAMLHSRALAAASGIHEGFVWCVFLSVTAGMIAININLVGGLMLFSLITCPAAAAYQICHGYVRTTVTAALLGAVSGAGGFLISYAAEAPVGACICMLACAILGVAACIKKLRHE